MLIKGRQIGRKHAPYIIAEMSCNHNQVLDRALDIIKDAHWAGADAIKLQIFDPTALAEARGGPDKRLESGPWEGMTLGELYEQAYTPKEWIPVLDEACKDIGLTWFASVFSPRDVEFLNPFDCPAYKISSFDVANKTLLASVALRRKPTIISCGMGTDDEIGHAIHIMRRGGGIGNVALLHCISEYPAKLAETNMSRIQELERRFFVPVGWSDHTVESNYAAAIAVSMGACIIERHITVDPETCGIGLDDMFSLDGPQFRYMVQMVKKSWQACWGDQKTSSYSDLKVVN